MIRNKTVTVFGIVAVAATLFCAVYALAGKEDDMAGNGSQTDERIILAAGGTRFVVELTDNPAAEAFRTRLPLTLKLKELNRNEKYGVLSPGLPAAESGPGTIREGDLMLYGSTTLVIFYETFASSYRYTRLGRVPDPDGLKEALGTGEVTVIFETEKKEIKMFGENEKRLAAADAAVQTADPALPTRVVGEGTRIRMHFNDTVIPGILNGSETAQALAARLPYTIRMNRYDHDFCGVMAEPLPYREDEVHFGWLNGDIDFATDGDYFTILFEDEENSESYGHQVNIGVIDCELAKVRALRGRYEVRIELAE